MLQSLLNIARAAFLRDNRHRVAQAHTINNGLTGLDNRITAYLATLDQENMNQDDHRRLDEILTFCANITHAASITSNGLLGHTTTLRNNGWALTREHRKELPRTTERLTTHNPQTDAPVG